MNSDRRSLPAPCAEQAPPIPSEPLPAPHWPGQSQFRPEMGGALCAPFYDVVRAGAATPDAVLGAVELIYQERRNRATPDRQRDYHQAIVALHEDRESALQFAAYVIDREKLPPAERQAEKQRRRDTGRQAAMAARAASAAQLSFLAVLNYDGPPPATMAEAHALIDELRTRREGQK